MNELVPILTILAVVILAFAALGDVARRTRGSLALWLVLLAILAVCGATAQVVDVFATNGDPPATAKVLLLLGLPPLMTAALVLQVAQSLQVAQLWKGRGVGGLMAAAGSGWLCLLLWVELLGWYGRFLQL